MLGLEVKEAPVESHFLDSARHPLDGADAPSTIVEKENIGHHSGTIASGTLATGTQSQSYAEDKESYRHHRYPLLEATLRNALIESARESGERQFEYRDLVALVSGSNEELVAPLQSIDESADFAVSDEDAPVLS